MNRKASIDSLGNGRRAVLVSLFMGFIFPNLALRLKPILTRQAACWQYEMHLGDCTGKPRRKGKWHGQPVGYPNHHVAYGIAPREMFFDVFHINYF